jgi:hypothetical protein
MTYTDYFLKFPSKQQAVQVFSTISDHISPENEIVDQTEHFAIDEVGVLFEDDAVYDENGNLITPPTQIDGYHYNYRILYGNKPEIPLPVELESYLVHPEPPQRTFF